MKILLSNVAVCHLIIDRQLISGYLLVCWRSVKEYVNLLYEVEGIEYIQAITIYELSHKTVSPGTN